MNMRDQVIGIDVGGTKIAGALVDGATGEISPAGVWQQPTFVDTGPGDPLESICQVIEAVLSRNGVGAGGIGGIGVCIPAPVHPETGFVYNPPNLRGWRDVPLKALLEARFPMVVTIDNDANAAALAETRWGAAKGYGRSVVYVTVSTGIGTGFVVNNALLRGKNGAAGEGGHVAIEPLGERRCGCGNLGCIEALASGTAMTAWAIGRIRREGIATSLVALAEGDLERITMTLVGQAAREGDAFAREIIATQGKFLGIWLGGMVSLFDPEIIVIGGGCANLGKPLFEAIGETMVTRTINPFAREIPIVQAAFGTHSGVIGAAGLVPGRG
ncbi:MAG: ROK family protein [Magnetococcales bacterium]|nr:ROK family protein [Magnetococcales bacterium]MBF0156575.1 ROK family protein [Magnetococcales bacterium]